MKEGSLSRRPKREEKERGRNKTKEVKLFVNKNLEVLD